MKLAQRHKERFGFPARPAVSHRCQHLIASLIQDKETRLCSKRYRFKDLCTSSTSSAAPSVATTSADNPNHTSRAHRDFAGRYVFPYDAEDVKSHKWFRGVPWDHLHQLEPPHVPKLRAQDDTHYFDEEEEISDWSESQASESSDPTSAPPNTAHVSHSHPNTLAAASRPSQLHHHQQPPTIQSPSEETGAAFSTSGTSRAELRARQKEEEARVALQSFRRSIQRWAMGAITTPYDTQRLRNLDIQIETFSRLAPTERAMLKHFVRVFGKREKKRPRDRLLRDPSTRGIVMEVRKKTAFLGYTWRRMRPAPSDLMTLLTENGNENAGGAAEATAGQQYFGDGSGDTAVESGTYWDRLGRDFGAGDGCLEQDPSNHPAVLAAHQIRMSWH